MLDALATKALFTSIKLHFTTEAYDVLKYNYGLKAPTQNAKAEFLKNNQRHLFARAGRHQDPKGLMIANMLENPKSYISDLLTSEAEEHWQNWRARQTKLTYLLKEDLERDDLLSQILKVDENGLPILISRYIRKLVTPETIVIIDSFANKLDTWAKIEHPLVTKVHLRLRKYRPLVTFDKNKARAVIQELKSTK